MHRRKPSSAKQKKAKLQQKRAIKRGDISPPPTTKPDTRHRNLRVPPAQSSRSLAATQSARRLQSSFVKLSKDFLDDTRRLAANLPLPRPIPSDAAVWNDALPPQDAPDSNVNPLRTDQLTCPKRPKWRYDMTKVEVEKNEEGLFKKWLDQTDTIVSDWNEHQAAEALENEERMPSAPTSFERNLEVWRQLWRVTEISQILLILLDSRCPLLHYPPSLITYLSSPQFSRKRVILILTKVDIAGPARVEAWTRYLNGRYPGLHVVPVESYIEKSAGEGSGQRRTHEPFIPSAFRQKLVDALKETHASLLEPSERLKAMPDKLKTWKPPVKRVIDWDAVVTARGGRTGAVVHDATYPLPREPSPSGDDARPSVDDARDDVSEDTQEDTDEPEVEPEFLTVGLIGQPNVGKSSLLNALFGVSKVRASKTPGKTKHFQTLFWTPEVRLVDCPGLVMPSLVPMETQVLAGILPISRVSAVPLCVYHAARLLPLETIYALQHPSSLSQHPAPDKRTWREPRAGGQPSEETEVRWTAMDILTAFALKQGWVTAKAGRPDISRAGNAILRALAEGKILWAFWPPGTPPSTVDAHGGGHGTGIWIPHAVDDQQDFGETSDDDETDAADSEEEHSDSDSGSDETASGESDGHREEEIKAKSAGSRFFALSIDSIDPGEEDEREESEDDG